MLVNGSTTSYLLTANWLLFLRCLLILCVVLLTGYAPSKTDTKECFIEEVQRIYTPHVLYEAEVIGIGASWYDHSE